MDARAPEPAASTEGATTPPAPPPARTPRKNGVAFFAVVLALYALLGSLAQSANPFLGLTWSELCALLLPAFVAAAGSNLDAGQALLLTPRPGRRPLALAPLIGAAGFAVGGALMGLLSLVLPEHWLELFDLSRLFQRPPLERAALSAVAATLAPFCEEVAFRGWMLTALRTRHRPGTAIAGCALFFAIMHLDPVRFTVLVGLGLLYGWLAWRAGSIWPAVVAHAVNNALGLALTDLGAASGSVRAGRPQVLDVLAWASVTLAVGGAVLWALTAAYRRATPSPPPVQDALRRRDANDPSTAFRLQRVPPGHLAAIGAAAASLGGLLALAGMGRHG